MGVVRRADDHRVDKVAREQVLIPAEDGTRRRPRAELLEGLGAPARVRVGDGHDGGHALAQEGDVADVLLAHGASADDADPEGRGPRVCLPRSERGPSQGGKDAARRLEALPSMHHKGVVQEQHIARFPGKRHLTLLHELRHLAQRNAVDWRAIAQDNRFLANVARVVPTREGGDHGIEEDPLAVARVHAQGRQGRGDRAAITIR
mmetsp:Transcript_3982/g.11043  ORF Transcript_3982/g.11043 Transcript_3982/m.11043 type:complete len:205 (-) Transcript_3982:744-1358(-)